MNSRLGKWVVVALLVTVTGSHWLLFQTAAWVGMTIDFSQTECLTAALKKTFDGRHPCKLCDLISAEKKSERKKDSQTLETRIDFFLEPCATAMDPPAFPDICTFPPCLTARTETPPTPPPRLLHG